jgi:hypothetical protein
MDLWSRFDLICPTLLYALHLIYVIPQRSVVSSHRGNGQLCWLPDSVEPLDKFRRKTTPPR